MNGYSSPRPRPRDSQPQLERLEDRVTPSVSFTPDPLHPGFSVVHFDQGATDDALTLHQGSGGQLEYSLNGSPFSTDLDSTTAGVQPLALGVISEIDASLGAGNDTLTLDFSGGTVIPGLSGIHYAGGTGTDRVVATRDSDMTLSDTMLLFGPGGSGGAVSLSGIEQAQLTGGNSPNLVDAQGFTGSTTIHGGNQTDTIYGGSGNDNLSGDAGNDILFGMGGNDFLDSTNSGNAQMYGGDGNDLLLGGNGKDLMAGGDGNDTLVGGNGADTLFGEVGNDSLEGQSGNDQIDGGAGVDEVVATGSVSFVLTDTLLTGLGTDTLTGIEQARLTGGTNNNTIDGSGFSGKLTMDGGGGIDTLIGGTGENIYLKPTGQGGTTTMLGGGPGAKNHFELSPSGSVSLFDDGGFSEVSFATSPTSISIDLRLSNGTTQNVDQNGFLVSLNGQFENAFGSANNDTLIGNDATNLIDGGGGNDVIVGVSAFGVSISPDTLVGGDGNDTVTGGGGNDVIVGGTAFGTGATSLDTSITGDDSLTGGLGSDTIYGGNGNDVIVGGTTFGISGTPDTDTSSDSLIGGIGGDTIYGGGGNDVIVGGTAFGTGDLDTSTTGISDSLVGGLGSDTIDGGIGNDIIVGGTAFGIAGTPDTDLSSDSLTGGLGNDTIYGGGGSDVIVGGTGYGTADRDGAAAGGNDSLVGGGGADLIDGGTGSDIIVGGTGYGIGPAPDSDLSADTLVGGGGDDTVYGGGGSDIVVGGSAFAGFDPDGGSDLLLGGDGNDTLTGGVGDDTLDGGAGDDTYAFAGSQSLGSDLVVEAPDVDTDTLDFSGLGGAVTVDLAQTTPQTVSPGILTLTLGSAAGIENVIGSRFADVILGNARPNRLDGADSLREPAASGPNWNGVTQLAFLDFDTYTGPGEYVYTQAERDAIQAQMTADYVGFHVTFTQTAPASGQYATLRFNDTPVIGPGGLASEVDFRNINLGGSAQIDVNGLLGGSDQPVLDPDPVTPVRDNLVSMTATIGAHELAHLLGLRHIDSFGPIGSGISPQVSPDRFVPGYPGPADAFETNLHLMASPQSVGSSLFDATGNPFFGEREAVNLAFNEGGQVLAEQSAAHASQATAQTITLAPLWVPNTLRAGMNVGKDFAVSAVDVTGTIGVAGENDYYSFTGKAGDLLNLEVLSPTLKRFTDTAVGAIDSFIRVFDAAGNLVPYHGSVAANDDDMDEDPLDIGRGSILIDLVLPADGTYFIQVSAFELDPSAPTDTGGYELFLYRFDAGNATDGGDVLDGRGGPDTLAGGLGNDTVYGGDGNDSLIGGDGSDTLIGPNVTTIWQINTNGTGTINAVATFSGFEILTGGTGNDTFRVVPGASLSIALQGGGGQNLLDYSTYGTTVTVNLATGTATGVGSVAGIQNVFGGSGNDKLTGNGDNNILVGNGGNDTISGGEGRDVLIGGLGADSLTGSGGDDILIGSRTSYDADYVTLLGVMLDWARQDLDYAGRTTLLALKLNSTTVFADTSVDTMAGGLGTDWFFGENQDNLPDRVASSEIFVKLK